MNDIQEYPDDDRLIISDGEEEDDGDMFRKVATIESDDDGETHYSKKVEKRINKLVAERNAERDRVAQLERDLNAVKAKTGKDYTEQDASEITNKITQLKAQRKQFADVLSDSYDYEEAERIDDELIDLRLQEREARNSKNAQQHRQEEANQPTPPSEAMQDWQERNGWVFRPDKHKDRLNNANQIYDQLLKDGFDANDEDTYKELDKRLAGKSTQSRERPETNGVARGETSSPNETKGFTNADKEAMRKWGLNPNDAEARTEYMRNKG
jgi:hypothetical protein